MSENVIGKFCALGKKNTLVYPKSIPGYTSPEPQALTEDKQKLKFVYTPIKYKIILELDGGHYAADEWDIDYFTVEDTPFVPVMPHKEGYTFTGWNIKRVSTGEKLDYIGGVGDVYCTPTWREHAILVSGTNLHKMLEDMAGGDVNNIMAIQNSPTLIENDYYNISSTSTPILARFDSGIVYIYCQYDIYCNEDMSCAFKDMTILRDISALYNIICNDGTDISEMCSGCKLLSDLSPIEEEWGDVKFSDFTDAFKDTAALASGRVPEWYRWSVKVNYLSSTGANLGASEKIVIPGETIYPESYTGYKAYTESIIIDSDDKEYTFIYEPIQYKISYIVDGSPIVIPGAATHYTIEDIDYYPPELSKEGYKFSGWSPECIHSGEYGDVTFIATYIKI